MVEGLGEGEKRHDASEIITSGSNLHQKQEGKEKTTRFGSRKLLRSTLVIVLFLIVTMIVRLHSVISVEDYYKYADISTTSIGTPQPAYSSLPKKLYTVVGLESSGTHLVSEIIAGALNVTYREGDHIFEDIRNEHNDIEVQHFSLPHGSSCEKSKFEIVDVVYPSRCSRLKKDKECKALIASSKKDGVHKDRTLPIKYPTRFFLNITSHRDWYQKRGVESIVIIVVRDQTISSLARRSIQWYDNHSGSHCADETKEKEEVKIGTKIISEAIDRYALSGYDKEITITSNENGPIFRKLVGNAKADTALLAGHGLIVVSYEMLNQLGSHYVKMIYQTLGIKSDFFPQLRDGNKKYTKDKSTIDADFKSKKHH